MIEPMTGEIWEDAEGCLLIYVGDGMWNAMGTCADIPMDDPLIIPPLRLAFDVFGQAAITSLRYPNGFCYGVPAGRQRYEEDDDE